jgi:MFS transporter, UMF1 family
MMYNHEARRDIPPWFSYFSSPKHCHGAPPLPLGWQGVHIDEVARGTRIVTSIARPVSRRPSRRAVWSWAVYDLANTIFSMNIISLYFPLWVVNEMGGRDGHVSIANSAAMVIIILLAPVLGALSDQSPRRMPFLVGSTVLCCTATLFIGFGPLTLGLVLFVIANAAFQSSGIFYDALLPSVSTESDRGRVGGLGVSVGYVGAFLGVIMGLVVLELTEDGIAWVFVGTSMMFAGFALPCFMWVNERRRRAEAPPFGRAVRGTVNSLRETVGRLKHYAGLRRFLIGRLFYTDAANTLIVFMAVYATNETGFTETQAQILLMTGIAGAIPGGLIWGRIVDRFGPRRSLLAVQVIWAVVFLSAAAVGLFDLPGELLWVIAPLAGATLAGTWTSDRPFMLRLSPPRHLGQFYGLYSIMGRFASITGPMTWALIVDILLWGRPFAVFTLTFSVVIAFFVLRPVSDHIREWAPEELDPEDEARVSASSR